MNKHTWEWEMWVRCNHKEGVKKHIKNGLEGGRYLCVKCEYVANEKNRNA